MLYDTRGSWARDSGAKVCAGEVPEQATPPQQQHTPRRRSVRCACATNPARQPRPCPAPPSPLLQVRVRRGAACRLDSLFPGWVARFGFSALLSGLVGTRPPAPAGSRPAPGRSPCGQPGGASMAWRRRPEARGALALLALALCAPGARGRAHEWFSAVVSTEYVDPQTNRSVRSVSESGRFGDSSPKEGARGLVGVPRAEDRDPEGCEASTRFLVPGGRGAAPWVALVARGGCTFKEKVLAAARRNASAVVLYNEQRQGNLTAPMSHAGTGNIVVIMVSYPKGREIVELVQKDIPVTVTIGVGTRHVQEYISGQSVVFVAIAFITMMIISLAWLIFYYIQRFLYTGSQFGSQSHRKETKKVIGQLPLHTVKHGEKGIDVDAESCAVCIENFKGRDVIRILPCKHIFHRICIDPWLLDHRTCPMCKLDVIKALGYWGELEDAQEATAPESPPGGVSAADLSLMVADSERSDAGSSELPSTSDPVPPCDASFKEDAGENTALLETGGSDAQRDGPTC